MSTILVPYTVTWGYESLNLNHFSESSLLLEAFSREITYLLSLCSHSQCVWSQQESCEHLIVFDNQPQDPFFFF